MEKGASFPGKRDLLGWKLPRAVAFLLSTLLIPTTQKQNQGREGIPFEAHALRWRVSVGNGCFPPTCIEVARPWCSYFELVGVCNVAVVSMVGVITWFSASRSCN